MKLWQDDLESSHGLTALHSRVLMQIMSALLSSLSAEQRFIKSSILEYTVGITIKRNISGSK